MSKLTPAPNGYSIKLVRDKTPDVINGTGEPGDLWYDATELDIDIWLRLKLSEEVAEYMIGGGRDELCDVLAVVEGLARRVHDRTLEELLAEARADERGGFLDGVMMYGRHPEFDGIAEQEPTPS